MGRPLKIAKAQLLTMTATTAATGQVTVSEDLNQLNVIAGMPFVVAANTGNLVAGTTYWILQVVDANNFTVSETPLSVNWTYIPFTLGDAGPVTVNVSVNVVDAGFNNPAGPANTYGVVGGNTGIYGPQTLASVAIGITGGGQITTNDASVEVWGMLTDFANTLSAGSAIQLANGTDIGFVNTAPAYLTADVTNTYATGWIEAVSTAALNGNQPIWFSANIGGLVANATYYVTEMDGGGKLFKVSSTVGGPNATLVNDAVAVTAKQNYFTLTAPAAVSSLLTGYIYSDVESGFIVRQKGKTKYLVTGTTTALTGVCYTANVADAALTPNTMNIVATYDDASTAYVRSLNDYQSEVFLTTVAAGAFVPGTLYTIESVGTTDWTLIGAASNMTGITFAATGAGTGTGTAIVYDANPDVISSFNTAQAANVEIGQPNPVVTVNNA